MFDNKINNRKDYFDINFLKLKKRDKKNNNDIKKVKRRGGQFFYIEKNEYENEFWKDNDFLVSNNNLIKKRNDCI